MPSLLLLLLAVLLLFAAANGYPPTCGNATCGGLTIAYPFWLNSSSASNCGYRGLGLACEGNTTLILPAQSHHRYRVSGIDYDTHSVFLVDDVEAEALNTASCPHLHFNFTIDAGSALQLTQSDSNITFFYNCKRNASWPSAVELTGCPDYNGSSYAFAGDGYTDEASEYGCEAAVVAPVLDAHKKAMMEAPPAARYVEVLKGGFELNYSPHSEQCGACERSGGWCGYRRNQTHGGVGFACYCDGGPTADQCGSGRQYSKKTTRIYIIAVSSSIPMLCLLFFAFWLGYKKYGCKRKSKETARIESYLQKNGTVHPKRYAYAQVKRMTRSFAEKLGQGGFGAVYRGDLSDGRQIAVKMLKDFKTDGEDFINELASISRTSHVNVVTLLGFCLEGTKRALIYDYMPNGSLERYAFKDGSEGGNTLGWEKLFEIAVGIARGLEYLHRGCNTRIVHFDIKPHNILLDQNFCPKISDFGLAKLCLNKESVISIGGARGTIGYIAPEVYSKQFGAVSSKSDVYSYGMMVLEMVGARDKNISPNTESSSQYFPQWIYEHLDEYCISASEINGEITEVVRKMIVVGLWCIQLSSTDRPTMTRVVEMLEGSTTGLELPPKVLLS
ncbi:LEAF RUST 10 DISEASE-RESISTANCE LOCUS RECEPTOR-LIKE PROTEIN KINASE-like 2.1 isoform X2 [Triticum dicoccoides]|uniref:LEAF RUST 10 DISEASE-RESISTANCE LOCUS RECEPTOR-LIKE PROTEIN KINASE-like 2.1 isoform X2 n=1 Tax=Triticum dicoccoides TaxID=85692 RepID=UPI00188F88CB|nr:LEAF RUST 10 DISEASE-RESISTANCE LOCUS RECEPTOR-LIKE PROTEIN KINASE-like 2.1 isoform X2 [Triticum dicoccoides]